MLTIIKDGKYEFYLGVLVMNIFSEVLHRVMRNYVSKASGIKGSVGRKGDEPLLDGRAMQDATDNAAKVVPNQCLWPMIST
jgi:hypothetical protein